MARPRRQRAFTTRATRSLPPTGRFFCSGIWSSPLAQLIASVAAHRQSSRSSGKSGGSIPGWPPPTRRPTESPNVTVTFIARQRGYCLGMNRDEKLTRPTGLPPKRQMMNGRAVISPSEPGGGTWIAVNDHGATLALINWYSITARVGGNVVSRGEVVNSGSAATSPDVADSALHKLPLNRINPFRLIGIYPATSEIIEWRWNLKNLVRKSHRWKAQQWISSGFDEPTAQRLRGKTFQRAARQHSA